MIIIIFVLLPLSLIYPYFIVKKSEENLQQKNLKNKKIIFINIGKILLVSLIAFILAGYILSIYDGIIPESTSDLCVSTGGWNYSCDGDDNAALPIFLLLELVIAVHHFITQKLIFEMFENSGKIFKYIYMYIHMFITYFINIWLFFYLYGLFISVNYSSIIVGLLRTLVSISPTGLFFISTILYKNKNKKI